MYRTRVVTFALSTSLLMMASCSGGSRMPAASVTPTSTPPAGGIATTQSATGAWEGTVTSHTTGQTVPMLGLVDGNGMSAWMTTDGRVVAGPIGGMTVGATLPMMAFVDGGVAFPNGGTNGPMTFMLDAMATGTMSGRMAGLGDTFTMKATMHATWTRPASLATVAGVYSRATSSGYTVSMSIDTAGALTINDSRGCMLTGAVSVPNPTHNLYRLAATVTACGTLNGAYTGMGTLVDASAMVTWMQQMIPIAHAGPSGGGMMGGGGMMPGQNTVATGAKNLFMFMLLNDQHAIMDSLAR